MTTDAEALSVHKGGGVRMLPGVAPVDDADGFRLRLQHLPDVEVVRDDIVLASEFGEELLDYVLKVRPDA